MMADKKIKIVDGQMYEYELYNLVDPYSDILKQKLEPFDFNNQSINAKYLAVSLIETMVKYRGVGLSANQVGLPYRVFVMGAEKVGFACFNPEILESHGEDNFEEGCLSFPGLFLPIKRPSSVKVRYTDFNGVTKEETFIGFTARIFQHEFDHLEGIVHLNKVSPIVLERGKKKVKSNLKKLNKQRKAFELERNIKSPESKTQSQVTINETPRPTTFEYKAG
jgi:peptide deformylase